MDAKDLLKKLEGKTPEEQAKIVSSYVSDRKRKQTIEDERRDVRAKCFSNCKKMTKAQQEALIYEFLAKNHDYFNNKWLRDNHKELFAK